MQVERAKSPQYFHELRVGTCLANEISVHHEAALEEPLVARQENPSLPIGQFRQFSVVRVGTIGGIEADETQTPGQRAQVNIDHEADRVRGRRSNVGECSDVDVREAGVDGDAICALYGVVERHGYAVREDQVDLWMRHPETLDQILHRLATSDDMRPRDLAALRRQEVVQ